MRRRGRDRNLIGGVVEWWSEVSLAVWSMQRALPGEVSDRSAVQYGCRVCGDPPCCVKADVAANTLASMLGLE